MSILKDRKFVADPATIVQSRASDTSNVLGLMYDATAEILGQQINGEMILTINQGGVNIAGGYHSIECRNNLDVDILNNIGMDKLPEGRFLMLKAQTAARNITLRHNAGGIGQMKLVDNANFILTGKRWITLVKNQDQWVEINRSYGDDFEDARDHLGVDSTIANKSITNAKLADSMIGKHSIYMPAGAILPTKTNGAKSKVTHLAGNIKSISTLDFSGSIDNKAQFSIAMPKSWNAGAVQFQLYWLCDHLTITNGATFKIAACSIGKADSFIKSFGVETSLTSNPTATKNDLIISAISGDLIIKDAAANKLAFFQIYRDVSDSGDTIATDVKLIGINLTYTTISATDN